MDRRDHDRPRRHAPRFRRAARSLRPLPRVPPLLGRRQRRSHGRRRPSHDAQPRTGRMSGHRGCLHPHGDTRRDQVHLQDRGQPPTVLPEAHPPHLGSTIPLPPRVRSHHQRVRYSVVPPRRSRQIVEELPHLLLEAPPSIRHFPGTVCVFVFVPSHRRYGSAAGRPRREVEGPAFRRFRGGVREGGPRGAEGGGALFLREGLRQGVRQDGREGGGGGVKKSVLGRGISTQYAAWCAVKCSAL
mmetsp:Transcript_24727/g.72382  ORF Transcript_24727/g.72382 Transcript_24727/m.72382 type:complete len:243 (+) Transcript_24727:1049-1777(+)